jgi:hypothetical protein
MRAREPSAPCVPPLVFRLNPEQESYPHRGWRVRPSPYPSQFGTAGVPLMVLTAVLGTARYAALRRSLERKSLIFLGLGFFFASQLRWR